MLSSLVFSLAAAFIGFAAASRPATSVLGTRQSPAVPLPSSFSWTSTGPLVRANPSDGREISGIKDPSVVYHDGLYHVFASTARETAYSLIYFSFADFGSAPDAEFHYLDTESAIGEGYRAAPQVFWFEPHSLWYLVYQNGNAAYSTNPNISDPAGWTAPVNFYPAGMPAIVSENIGDGYWVDMWVICDAEQCHLFSSDDNGHLYRSETSVANFPDGMSQPVIDLEEPVKGDLYEAACVYLLPSESYLLVVECLSPVDGRRYFRSWTSDSIAGPWDALADTEANPFAGSTNVVFDDGVEWTESISHGELVRTQTDQTMAVSPCDFRWMYQGLDPAGADTTYNALPWELALLTLENVPAECGGVGEDDVTDAGGYTGGDTGGEIDDGDDGDAGCEVAKWHQCGGLTFTGCTQCESGTTCQESNQWYSQCF